MNMTSSEEEVVKFKVQEIVRNYSMFMSMINTRVGDTKASQRGMDLFNQLFLQNTKVLNDFEKNKTSNRYINHIDYSLNIYEIFQSKPFECTITEANFEKLIAVRDYYKARINIEKKVYNYVENLFDPNPISCKMGRVFKLTMIINIYPDMLSESGISEIRGSLYRECANSALFDIEAAVLPGFSILSADNTDANNNFLYDYSDINVNGQMGFKSYVGGRLNFGISKTEGSYFTTGALLDYTLSRTNISGQAVHQDELLQIEATQSGDPLTSENLNTRNVYQLSRIDNYQDFIENHRQFSLTVPVGVQFRIKEKFNRNLYITAQLMNRLRLVESIPYNENVSSLVSVNPQSPPARDIEGQHEPEEANDFQQNTSINPWLNEGYSEEKYKNSMADFDLGLSLRLTNLQETDGDRDHYYFFELYWELVNVSLKNNSVYMPRRTNLTENHSDIIANSSGTIKEGSDNINYNFSPMNIYIGFGMGYRLKNIFR
jgi:hypothetical protein